ncbi:hypothetical protein EI94DRAFT_1420235, partial [Lactarius quietus]
RWAKLQLPNGQKARSVWYESTVTYGRRICIANVRFYFCLWFRDVRYPLAIVDLLSEPDEDILSESSGMVHLCDQNEGVAVVSIAAIHSVVAMFP